jgi:hypothetical protein
MLWRFPQPEWTSVCSWQVCQLVQKVGPLLLLLADRGQR